MQRNKTTNDDVGFALLDVMYKDHLAGPEI